MARRRTWTDQAPAVLRGAINATHDRSSPAIEPVVPGRANGLAWPGKSRSLAPNSRLTLIATRTATPTTRRGRQRLDGSRPFGNSNRPPVGITATAGIHGHPSNHPTHDAAGRSARSSNTARAYRYAAVARGRKQPLAKTIQPTGLRGSPRTIPAPTSGTDRNTTAKRAMMRLGGGGGDQNAERTRAAHASPAAAPQVRVIATSNALPFICGHYTSAHDIACVRFQ